MEYKISSIKPFGSLVEPKDGNISIAELNVEELRNIFRESQLILLRGFKTFENSKEFSKYCDLWGEVSLWPFGKVLELIEQENPEDHIFDNSYVPLHWDGMYRPQVPEYQIFHCVKSPLLGQGGRTTFSNTILALNNTPKENFEYWKKILGIYQRKMEFYNSKTKSPIVSKHPYRDFSVIRYNEPPSKEKGHFVNPPEFEFVGINKDELDNFHKNLQFALYNPSNFYAHEWQTGDVVIADNFSLLHGREGFISKAPRHLQRVQVLSSPAFNNPGLESYQ